MGRRRKHGSITASRSELRWQPALQDTSFPAAWIAPVGLAIAFILLNLAGGASFDKLDATAVGPGDFITILLMASLAGTEPVALAIWAALGPPPALWRIILTTIASSSASYAITARLPRGSEADAGKGFVINALFLGVFLILTLCLTFIRRFSGWQIEHGAARFKQRDPMASQLGKKELLSISILLIAVLAVGLCLWPLGMFSWHDKARMTVALVAMSTVLAFVLLPAVSAFGITLAHLCGQRRLTAPLAMIWGVVDLVLVLSAILVPIGTEGKEEGLRAFYLVALVPLQLAYLLASVPIAAAIYFGGYRLVRRKSDAA